MYFVDLSHDPGLSWVEYAPRGGGGKSAYEGGTDARRLA